MRKLLFILLLSYIYLFNHNIYAQPIPYGTSIDSVHINGTYRGPLEYDSKLEIYYYKPANYDSVNSPILLYIPGSGGATGAESSHLQSIADRRKALIISPTPPVNFAMSPWEGAYDMVIDTIGCAGAFGGEEYIWLPHVFKQIYRHVLARSKRDSIPVYFTGFSGGAQCVTRYMLVRQFFPDSIPIKMAVSMDPAGYLFCTKTFTDSTIHFPFGLAKGLGELEFDCKTSSYDTIDLHFLCNEHIVQYYNENYGMLIGSADTAAYGSWPLTIEGYSRYVRAKNFFNFSDTNAITRGTTLKWIYDTVPGVAHSSLLFSTVAAGDSMPILERMLFKTPWHPVPHNALVIDFSSNTRVVALPNATVQFYNNSINASTYLWNFGDGSTSTAVNPSHTYAVADTFTVKLTASSGSSCTDTLTKQYFIIVKNATGVNELQISDLGFEVYPNPSSGVFAIESKENKYEAIISDMLGEKIYSSINNSTKSEIDLSSQPNGIYFLQLKTSAGIANKKIIIQK